MTPSLYSDLFDDGIPARNFLLAEDPALGSFDRRLLDTVRFQCLLAIIFGRVIAVPEVWMASSPLFLRVFEEIDFAFAPMPAVAGDAGPRRTLATYPFRFVFFGPIRGDPARHFLAMLNHRLVTGRRIRWLPEGVEDPGARLALAARLADLGTARDGGLGDAAAIAGRLKAALRDTLGGGPGLDFGPVAVSLGRLVARLSRLEGSEHCVHWGSGGRDVHAHRIAQSVARIRANVLDNADLRFRFPYETNQFRSFFEEAERAGAHLHDLMTMWPLLERYDPSLRRTVEAFGRKALNESYAASTLSAQGLLSFDLYADAPPDRFSVALLRAATAVPETADGGGVAVTSLLDLAPVSSYDLADTLDWATLWNDVWAITHDPAWIESRDSLTDELAQCLIDGRPTLEWWQRLFDRINARISALQFRLQGGTEAPFIEITTRELRRAGLGSHLDRGQQAALVAVDLLGATGLSRVAARLLSGERGATLGLHFIRRLRDVPPAGAAHAGAHIAANIVHSRFGTARS